MRTRATGKPLWKQKVTKVYRMPKTGKAYAIADDWSIDTDIRAAAARDYDLDSYGRVILTWPSLAKLDGSRMEWSGYGQIGGRYIWLNGYWIFKAVSHELGREGSRSDAYGSRIRRSSVICTADVRSLGALRQPRDDRRRPRLPNR